MSAPTLLIVTGEASGDLHGANLAKALKARDPNIRLLGVGGQHMRAAGVELLQGLKRLDAVGVPGPVTIGKGIFNLFTMKRFFKELNLNGVVFVDNPSMNLRLARMAAKLGHRVIYYIAPQIWAWGRHRIHLIKRVVRRMIVILPFEEAIYRDAGVPCDFVGHPLLDTLALPYDRRYARKQLGLPEGGLIIGVLPGSRLSEVQPLLPEMIQAVKKMRTFDPDVRCVVGQAQSISSDCLEALIDREKLPVTVVANQTNEVMAAADLLLVASGTATLQAALVGTPMIITYRLSWLTYHIAKRIALVKHLGLVNLVAGRGVVPELLQEEATADRLFEEAMSLLKDRERYRSMEQSFISIREQMGAPGASDRAAEVVLAECQA
ncbi:lipid-A-disaccharide synthase [Candidatus Nitronereus thalassa]|uniref:Lipid-A-disaccharide synthase n=1 Tax=Candidatus Nitronereus thalassa TaxID=3020898 RepID=A0ABU3K5X4_9BACT|nr:lipid-A-disaccharide synthase [Candidatus Nitronereus thalassa]MDT7041817.1 lipid-A-disaccharide synthase [Candidatus Nitronereus thalassa]